MDNKETPQPIETPPTPNKYSKRGLLELFKPFMRILKPLSPEEKEKLSATAVGRNELERIRMDRKNFLKLGAATAVLLSKGRINVDIPLNIPKNPQVKTPEIKSSEDILDINLANKILNSDPGSDIRKSLENSYTNEATVSGKLKDIDTAFCFVSNTEDRVGLLEKRGEYRNSGKFGLRQLTAEEKAFCKANNFHEEWVAICIDSHLRTKEILQKKIIEMNGMANFIQKFRPDLEDLIKDKRIDPKTITLDNIMLPVGALIGIAWSESKTITKDGKIHALVDIGKVPSINYITGEKAKQKERDLFELLSVNGIKYNPDKILGSDKTGDIGSVQFRPDTALAFIEFCKEKDIDFTFNPLGLDAVTGACLMLSIGQKVPLDNGYEDLRMAYINGEEGNPLYKHMTKSFQRWNPSLVDNILFWRKKYVETTKNN